MIYKNLPALSYSIPATAAAPTPPPSSTTADRLTGSCASVLQHVSNCTHLCNVAVSIDAAYHPMSIGYAPRARLRTFSAQSNFDNVLILPKAFPAGSLFDRHNRTPLFCRHCRLYAQRLAHLPTCPGFVVFVYAHGQ